MSKGEYRQDEGAVCFHGDAHGLLGNVFSESELNKYVINKELHVDGFIFCLTLFAFRLI
jgi:hypothetical protein